MCYQISEEGDSFNIYLVFNNIGHIDFSFHLNLLSKKSSTNNHTPKLTALKECTSQLTSTQLVIQNGK